MCGCWLIRLGKGAGKKIVWINCKCLFVGLNSMGGRMQENIDLIIKLNDERYYIRMINSFNEIYD